MKPPFNDDDDGYLAWLAQNPEGFVINTYRPPSPGYLRLHRAGCSTISGEPPNGKYWTRTSTKICGSRAELENWARNRIGGDVYYCPQCLPELT